MIYSLFISSCSVWILFKSFVHYLSMLFLIIYLICILAHSLIFHWKASVFCIKSLKILSFNICFDGCNVYCQSIILGLIFWIFRFLSIQICLLALFWTLCLLDSSFNNIFVIISLLLAGYLQEGLDIISFIVPLLLVLCMHPSIIFNCYYFSGCPKTEFTSRDILIFKVQLFPFN